MPGFHVSSDGRFHTAADPARPNNSGLAGRMSIRFWVEDAMNPGKCLKAHRMLVMPQDYNRSAEVRTRLAYTAGGSFVDRPLRDGTGFYRFTISGTTPFHGAPVNAGLPLGKLTNQIDGAAFLRDLDDTIQMVVSGRLAYDGSQRDPRTLVLLYMNEHEPTSAQDPTVPIYRVMPDALVSWSQNVRAPFQWQYRLSFTGEQVDLRRPVSYLPAGEASLDTSNPDGPVTAVAPADVTPAPEAIRDRIMLALSDLPDTAISAIPAGAREVYSAARWGLEAVAEGVGRFIDGTDSLINLTASQINGVVDDLREIQDHLYGMAEIPMPLVNACRNAARFCHQLACRDSDMGGSPSASNGSIKAAMKDSVGPRNLTDYDLPEASDPAPFGYGNTTIRDGDSLSDLAARLGSTPAKLIALNGLTWPFVDSSQTRPTTDPVPASGRRCLYLGDTMLVPHTSPTSRESDAVVGAGVPYNGQQVNATDNAIKEFGVDLLLDANGNLVLDPVDNDLALVSGLDNLEQAVRIGLEETVGSLAHSPHRGSYLLGEIGAWATNTSLRTLATSIRRSLLLDPRIAAIKDFNMQVAAGQATLGFTAVARTGTELEGQQARIR